MVHFEHSSLQYSPNSYSSTPKISHTRPPGRQLTHAYSEAYNLDPRRASSIANPLPMPLDAPVTMTLFPAKYSSVVTWLWPGKDQTTDARLASSTHVAS